MRPLRAWLGAALLLLLPAFAPAAWEPRGPEEGSRAASKKPQAPASPAPLAQALGLVFGPRVWLEVGLSSAPVAELSRLVEEGYYKLEMLQLLLMSARGRRPLREALERRKKGSRLSEIAALYRLDYDRLYESALAVEELLDREYLPRFRERPLRPKREEP